MIDILGAKFSLLRSLIQKCRNMRHIKQVHSQIMTCPYIQHKTQLDFLISRVLFFCALSDSGSLIYASNVFQRIKQPNLYVYNIMIRAYACKPNDTHINQALTLYKQMLSSGIVPDSLTLPFVLKECAGRVDGLVGSSIHGQAIKFGLYNDVFVRNSMLGLYMACGFLCRANEVFDEMSDRDVVSWNVMIIGYLRSGDLDRALDMFRRMENRNIVSWNSMITGFIQGGRAKEGLEFFREMQSLSWDDVVKPDKITIASVLSGCATLGAIDHGNCVHGYLKRSGLECDVVIGTALVDMYGKCGCVGRAYAIFKDMPEKDTLAWTAMISVFALHGYAREAFDTFEEMVAVGVKPNNVTFVSLLSACAHSGLVEKGRRCFDLMKKVYSMEPKVYHYACMVDILSRAGQFEEAEKLIRSMPMEPDVFVWGALLGGCQTHGNLELGEKVAHHLINLDPLNHAFYVTLCDIYAKASRFDDVKRVRNIMNERGIKKEIPGLSMIEVDGVVHEFSVTGSPEVVIEELMSVLSELSKLMKYENQADHVKVLSMEAEIT